MFVPPGTYNLSIMAQGNSSSTMGGSFVWELSCLPAGTLAAKIDFDGLTDAPTTRRTPVAISTDCMAQTLTLVGVAGETSAQINAEFSAVSLERR